MVHQNFFLCMMKVILHRFLQMKCNNKNWIGAIYYQVTMRKNIRAENTTRCLDLMTTIFNKHKKWIEILTFNENNEPVFGGEYFVYKDETIKPLNPVSAFCLEYKKMRE